MPSLDIKSILDAKLRAQKLAILVFGPTPKAATDPAHPSYKLAKKRIEIRDRLRAEGHDAEFPEDLLQGTNTPPQGQVLLYEEVLVANNDLVVMIVDSPGSNTELGYFSGKTTLAEKTQAFINSAYRGGLPDDTCHALRDLGGVTHYYDYPDDVDKCHLWGMVSQLVNKLQRRKLYQ